MTAVWVKSLGMIRPELSDTALSRVEASQVELNRKELKLGAGDSIPEVKGEATGCGQLKLPPASITFLAVAVANNARCR